MPDLRDWSYVGSCLAGRVYGHKKFADGTHIRTSKIKNIRGRWAQTVSGTVYHLREQAQTGASLDSPSQDISIVDEGDAGKNAAVRTQRKTSHA